MRITLPIIVLSFFLALSAQAIPAPVSNGSSVDETSMAQLIVDWTNYDRSLYGRVPLAVIGSLQGAAQHHANNMAQWEVMDHQLPWVDLPSLADRLAAYGFGWHYAGENLGAGFTAADAVVAAWSASPGHAANLYNENFRYVGIGVAQSASGRLYICQVLAAAM